MLHIRPQSITHTPRLALTFRKFSEAARLIQSLSFAGGTAGNSRLVLLFGSDVTFLHIHCSKLIDFVPIRRCFFFLIFLFCNWFLRTHSRIILRTDTRRTLWI